MFLDYVRIWYLLSCVLTFIGYIILIIVIFNNYRKIFLINKSKIISKLLIGDLIIILYPLIAIISVSEDLIYQINSPIKYILKILSILLSCLVIYVIVKKQSTLFKKY